MRIGKTPESVRKPMGMETRLVCEEYEIRAQNGGDPYNGFLIIETVKDNPKEKTIHFRGIRGQDIRQCYMEMTHNTIDKDGNVKTLPLFADIDVRTPKYTFSHPNGLLFATQFAQIALVILEKAAFEDMQVKGFVQKPECAFARHSLGEYSTFASIADDSFRSPPLLTLSSTEKSQCNAL